MGYPSIDNFICQVKKINMRFFIVFACSLSFLITPTLAYPSEVAVNLTSAERTFLSQHKSFLVHMEADYAPFSFVKDGEFTGFCVEFSDLISKRLGISFKYNRSETWHQAIENIKNGKIDIVAQIIVTPERKKFLNFTSGYMRYFNSIVVLKEKRNELNSLEKLSHKKVGIVAGYIAESVIKANFPQIEIISFDSTKVLVERVISGEIDAALSTHQVVQYNILSRFINDVVSIPIVESKFLPEVTESFGIRKEYSLLSSAMQKAINSLDEEKHQLQIRWFGEPEKKEVVLTMDEKNFLSSFGTIKYCIDPDWNPIEFKGQDGIHKGLSSGFLTLFSKKSGVAFEYIPTKSWMQSLEFFKNRHCDIMPMVMQTDDRKKYMSVTTPYVNFPLVIATKSNEPFISDFNRTLDKTFAFVQGYAYIEKLRHNYDGLRLIETKNSLEGLKLVTSGKVFGYIDTAATISQQINEHNLMGIKISGKLDEEWKLCVGVRNDYPELLSIMQKNIDSIKKEERQLLTNHWVAVRYEKGFDYRMFWKVIAVITILGLIFIYRYREQSRMHKKIKSAYTKLENAQKESVNSERTLREIIDFLPDPTFVINKEGEVTHWNKAIERLSGIKADQILGNGNFEYAIPFYGKRRRVLADFALMGEDGIAGLEENYSSYKRDRDSKLLFSEIHHPNLNGKNVYLSGSASPLFDFQGNLIGAVETIRNITEEKILAKRREELIRELQDALEEVKTLSGLLPICSSCKKIRDDKGYWNQIESYLEAHSKAEFSHSLCPECADKLYGKEGWYIKMKKNKGYEEHQTPSGRKYDHKENE